MHWCRSFASEKLIKLQHFKHWKTIQISTGRNQPSNLYWTKDSWLEELGTDAVAVWYVEGEQLSVNLFLLAVDQNTKSELNAPITHLLGFEGHAYQLVRESGLKTLGKTLTLLPTLFRYYDVGIDM